MRISDWSSDVCSSDLEAVGGPVHRDCPRGLALQSRVHARCQQLLGGLVLLPGFGRPHDGIGAQGDRVALPRDRAAVIHPPPEIGRASCRERVCQYVYISVVAVYLNKKSYPSTYFL